MFQDIPLKNIIPSKFNYRQHVDEAALEELTASVKSKGVLQPILVRPLNGKQKGKYEIVAGHRRHQAALSAGLKLMPAMVKDLTDEEALEVQVIENTQREDPNPMDEALGFKRLLDMGKHTPETLALRLDRSITYVLSRVKLADLDPKVQDAIASGDIGPGHAVLFTRLKNHGDQKEFLKLVLEGDWSSDGPLSVREAKDRLNDEYMFLLTDAPFDTTTCATCAYRSSNQAALFPELKKTDECTDKSCYQNKTKQHYTALLKEKSATGFKVFTDEKEIKKLMERSKTSAQIVPEKNRERTYSGVFFPKKYKSACTKCTEHHAFYFYEEKDAAGKNYEFGEVCLNRSCLDGMNKEARKEERSSSGTEESGRANPHTLRVKAIECRNRFLLKALAPRLFSPINPDRVDAAPTIQMRLLICHIIKAFRNSGNNDWVTGFIHKFNPAYPAKDMFMAPLETLYRRGIAGIPAGELTAALDELLAITFSKTDPDVMLQMTPEAGIDMARDFEMDEEYLNGKTKDELFALMKELDIEQDPVHQAIKKGAIVEHILYQPLTGKVPAVIAEVCKLDNKGVDDEEGSEDGVCDECGEAGEDCMCEGGPDLSGGDTSAPEEKEEEEKDCDKCGYTALLCECAGKAEAAAILGEAPEDDPTMPVPTKTGRKRKKA